MCHSLTPCWLDAPPTTAARPRIEAYLHSIHDYSKFTYTLSKESVGRVTERWQPFVTRFDYHPPDLERCAP